MSNGSHASPAGNRTVMIILSYLWILALVPLLVEKEDQEVQWHAKHGLVLTVAEIVFWIAFTIVGNVLSFVTFGLGCFLGLFVPLISLGIVILHVFAIVRGLDGRRLIVPGISEYANRF